MSIYSLFNISRAAANTVSSRITEPHLGPEISARKDDAPPGADTPSSVGAFVTPQSLVSFAGATGVISALYSFVRAVVPLATGVGIYVVAVLSAMVGCLIFLISTADPAAQVLDRKGRIVAIVIAVINTVILFNATRAVLGV